MNYKKDWAAQLIEKFNVNLKGEDKVMEGKNVLKFVMTYTTRCNHDLICNI